MRTGSRPETTIDRHVRAVVFDMDGTLLDSLPVVVECYRRTVVSFGGPDLSVDEVLRSFAIGPAAVMLSTLIGRDVGPSAISRYETLLAREAARIRVYDGIAETVTTLSERIPLGVFTAADTSAAELLLSATGLRPVLGPVLGADRARFSKPSPDGLIAVSERLGVAPVDVAYVGDGPADVEVARACGALAVAAAWGDQFRDGRGADITLSSPAELLSLAPMPSEASREGGP